MVFFVIFWTLCGTAASHLLQGLCSKHQDMEPWSPDCVWLCLAAGPIILALSLFVAVGYALNWDKETSH